MAAALCSLCPPDAGTAMAPRRQLRLRSAPLTRSLSWSEGRRFGLRSWWGGAAPAEWSRHPFVLSASGGNYNVQVVVKEDEPEEEMVRRFRGVVLRAGIIQECKRRRFFEDRQAERKRRSRDSAKRNRRRRPPSRSSSYVDKRQDRSKEEEEEEEEDNWELPDGIVPY